MTQREADIDTLARTIWAEARGEGLAGMKAVACVIVNRFKKPGWWSRNRDNIPDDTIQAVCMDPWQFSCWSPNDPNLAKLLAVTPEDKQFEQALQLAETAVDGHLSDITGGATHYYSSSLHKAPFWADGMTRTVVWGHHTFMA